MLLQRCIDADEVFVEGRDEDANNGEEHDDDDDDDHEDDDDDEEEREDAGTVVMWPQARHIE